MTTSAGRDVSPSRESGPSRQGPTRRAPSAAPGAVERLRGAGNRAVASVLSTGAPLQSVVQRAHVPIPTAVTEFQNKTQAAGGAATDPTVSDTGQFFWTQSISTQLRQKVTALRARVATMPNPEITAPLLDWVTTVLNLWGHDQAAFWAGEMRRAVASARLIAPAAGPALDLVGELLAPCPAPGADPMKKGKAMWGELWGELDRTDTMPVLTKYHNLASLGAVWEWENQACGFTGNVVARRYQAKGGAKTLNPDARRRAATAVGATLATSGRRDMRESYPGFRRGDLLVQHGVAAVAAKMKVALDDGWVLHARVLSGIDYGHGESVTKGTRGHPLPLGAPPQEHSIMIIGYDGDTFAFWDPDSGSSRTFGPGFGALHADLAAGRLSTAVSDLDIDVDVSGNHASGVHRYQVITIGSQ